MDDKLEQYLSKLDKKLDKILNMQTKIAKTLHLIPVTEKEEKAIQIQQRKNMATAANVHNELEDMENKGYETPISSLADLFKSTQDVYEDVIGNDYIGGGK